MGDCQMCPLKDPLPGAHRPSSCFLGQMLPRSIYNFHSGIPRCHAEGTSVNQGLLILGEQNMPRSQSKYVRQASAHRNTAALSVIAAATVALLLTGCSPSAPQIAPSAATPSQTMVSHTAAAHDSVPSTANKPDKTADFRTAKKDAPWLDKVKSVTETEPGRIRIETSVVDPRGDDGSEVAKSAIAICESAVTLFGPSYVSVLEDDGINFVLFGHPSVPKGVCTEV